MDNTKKTQNKKYSLVCEKEHSAIISNDIIFGKQTMTLQAARLIRLVISNVLKEDKDLRTYTCKITELAKFFGVSDDNLYRDVQSICETLHKSCVYVGTGNPKRPWKLVSWVSMSEYTKDGNLTIRLSEELKPYVIAVKDNFTPYQIKNLLDFSSFYAIRLYEILKCERGRTQWGEVVFSVRQLREMLGCETKYKEFRDFKKRAIEIAIKEINQSSDIYVIPSYIKEGRSVEKISFEIFVNQEPSNENSPVYKYLSEPEAKK